MAKRTRILTKAKLFTLRLRQPDIEALYGLARHYEAGRSEVVRLLLTREWARVQGDEQSADAAKQESNIAN